MMTAKALLFGDTEAAGRIRAAPHPGAAKALGREVRGFDEQLWAGRRFDLVVTGNLAKFGQHQDLRDFLLATGSKVLVEAVPAAGSPAPATSTRARRSAKCERSAASAAEATGACPGVVISACP